MNLIKNLTVAADTSMETGHVIFKVVEEFKKEISHKIIDLECDFSNQ